jgi:hypothetical protein
MIDSQTRLAAALADRYRVEKELGAGGMATVYLAHDLRHERDVAIKVLHPDLGAALGADRFLAEIKTTARLQHPHILPLLDSGAADGLLYYVMPYVRGETLRSRLERERQLPIADAIRIAREVAGALDHAHRQGIIHRDIKPENILLQDGAAFVADFGIALAVQHAGGQRMTQTGLSLGTPQYMSPEQAMGEKVIDARSDIYALGAVTYEMLTGEAPFDGNSVQAIVAKILNERPVPPSTFRDTVSGAVSEAVLTALAKTPADRFGSAAQFAEALSATSQSAPLIAAVARTRLSWRALTAVGIAGVLLGAAATARLRGAPRLRQPGDRVPFERNQITFDGESMLPALSTGGDLLAFVRARCAQEGHFAGSAAGVDGADPVPCPMSVLVQDTGGTAAVTVLADVPHVENVRWLGSGTALVVRGTLDSVRTGLFIVPRLGGAPRQLAADGVFDTHPFGDTVFVAQSHATGRAMSYVIAAATGSRVDSFPLPVRDARTLAASADGKLFAVGTEYGGALHIIRRDGSRVDSVTVEIARQYIRWTPDNRGLLFFVGASGREDVLMRLDLDASGHVEHAPVAVMPKVQVLYTGQFDVARGAGNVAFAIGDWRQQIARFPLGTPAMGMAQVVSSGNTYYSTPISDPSGRALYFIKTDALGDNLYERTLSDSSRDDRAASTLRGPGSWHVTLSTDDRITYFVKSSVDSAWLGRFDRTARAVTLIPIPRGWANRRAFASASAGRLLDRSTSGRALLRADSTLRHLDTLTTLPDSERIVAHETSPDGTHVAVLTTTDKTTSLVVSSVETWSPRVVGRWSQPAPPSRLSWRRDGTVLFASWLVGRTAPVLWSASADGSRAATVLGALPTRCSTLSTTIAREAPLGVCTLDDARIDIFTGTLPGIEGNVRAR